MLNRSDYPCLSEGKDTELAIDNCGEAYILKLKLCMSNDKRDKFCEECLGNNDGVCKLAKEVADDYARAHANTDAYIVEVTDDCYTQKIMRIRL